MEKTHRCPWVKDSFEEKYHDTEWGKPEHNEKKLFEMLILEGMQAGLSWNMILKKRENMRMAFDDFSPEIIAEYGAEKEAELLQNPNIIRNKRKIASLSKNAKVFLAIQKEYGSFDSYIWGFVEGKPIQNHWTEFSQVPTSTELSDKISKDLKKRGCSFVGTTICYSYMQAIGLVNDHLISCDFYK